MGWMDIFRARPSPAPVAERGPGPVMTASTQTVESPSQWGHGFRFGGMAQSGARVDEANTLSIPATMAALRVLTGVFAMTPMHYFLRSPDGRQRASDDPLHALMLERPNLHQTPFQFRELMLADLLLAGNFFAYVSRDFAGRPVALTRLNPKQVTVATYFSRSEGRELFFDATLPDGARERFSGRDIWHIAGFGRDGLSGLSPISIARDAIGSTISTSDHTAKFWRNGGRPSTVLKSDSKVDPADRQMMRQDWMNLYSGPSGSEVAILDQGLTADFLTHNHQEQQFLETRGFQVVDLCRVWGVPPHLIFHLDKATFSNIEHQSLEFITFHMGPHYERVSQSATFQFAGRDHYFEHLTDALVKGDLKSRMEAYKMQREMGVANANDLRRRENEPDIAGDAGTEYWRPSNMAISGQPNPPSANAPAPTPAPAE